MKPKLQLALDVADFDRALSLCAKTVQWVDCIESGTPLIIKEGLRTVASLKAAYPHKTIVADVKIVDAASLLSTLTVEANADILTVLSAASEKTIRTCVEIAHAASCEVLGDHISNQISLDACRRLEDLGVDFIGIHIPKDSQADLPFSELETLMKYLKAPIVLAGGITKQRLEIMKGLPIHTFVIGGAIIDSPSPAEQARRFASILDNWTK